MNEVEDIKRSNKTIASLVISKKNTKKDFSHPDKEIRNVIEKLAKYNREQTLKRIKERMRDTTIRDSVERTWNSFSLKEKIEMLNSFGIEIKIEEVEKFKEN